MTDVASLRFSVSARKETLRLEQHLVSFLLRVDGMICDCDEQVEVLLGYRRSDLLMHHISHVLPQLSNLSLMEDGHPNPNLSFRTHIGQPFDVVANNGNHVASKLFLSDLGNSDECRLRLIVRPMNGE